MRGNGALFFILYLILGVYELNVGLNFVKLPEFLLKINNWVVFVGGIFLILGGINYLRLKKYNP
jgi:hypothetical protein